MNSQWKGNYWKQTVQDLKNANKVTNNARAQSANTRGEM